MASSSAAAAESASLWLSTDDVGAASAHGLASWAGGDVIEVRVLELEKGGKVPGSETLHYDVGDGFESTPLVALGDDLYEARFPSVPCGATVGQ